MMTQTASSTLVDQTCRYCGYIHLNRICHLVQEIEYHADGTIKRVVLRRE